jgi:predicted nuclease of predicted toxin-antitoxin system
LKFLIDECLSVALADVAISAGHPESAHVTHRGMTGWKDHRLMKTIIEEDWTFVTRNSRDFRPRTGSLSKAACYFGQPLHAGLVCVNTAPAVSHPDCRGVLALIVALQRPLIVSIRFKSRHWRPV